ncbi:MAG: hypothetical protein UV78_C0025G0005 [Parcubacteria group bacterium GW2011_GWA2_43_17]|nr:MAG: hypothetical protein UV78_C0025G0005 [Parcubacteria group bacterium GW2011_GWA2_43_17]KKT94363.1 MAG: hypothetical protein UW91_C0002G0007 [Parcubacteria group bacterium GW2011_GWF2_45_11]KKT98717.1 MAG: hypothetical protein UW98_C0005G0037 [Parcubacteria group bacterium GW2011_GWC2_45_15]OGY93621.1 MAG: hypothetical protein A2260_03070 [Candidatus Komeilibacteria bacterium RIFOXYA2_FULL_45_9]OGY94576.1 MAG: hypothetical protein A3J95_03940 [Candidatus Komeilibacteria bacterium RIFOXYC2
MIIHYFGLGSFRLQSNGLSILLDPADSKTGIKMPRMQNDLVLYSHQSKDPGSLEKALVINCPGEYEAKGCFVYGIPVNHDDAGRTMFVIEVEGMRLAYLGAFTQAQFTEEQLDRLEGVDILMLPVGGGESLNSEKAVELVNQIEPRVVIPMYYQMPGLKLKLDPVEKFKKDSAYKSETVDKYKIVKKDLPQEETRLIIITPS